MQTIKQAMDFIYGTTWKGSVLGLSRIAELMRLLGDPQNKLKFVHIAGTNGKGSTAAMLASVLTEAGYKTGLYTSPYIESFNELIQINGQNIPDSEIIRHTAAIQAAAEHMQDKPTEYEMITALAFLHFHAQNCDIIALEVGMGGRLDSTNVIPAPEVAIITNIGLDHMAQLGNTPEKIAAEKAGIIKGGYAVCHPQSPTVEAVIREKCKQTDTDALFVAAGDINALSADLTAQSFAYKAQTYTIPLLGEHQQRNAAVVIETLQILNGKGYKIPPQAVQNGLRNTKWQGRFEVLSQNPIFIADVSHNPQGIQHTLKTLTALLPDKKPIFIYGVLADKDYPEMSAQLTPHAHAFILITPDSPRALPASQLAVSINHKNIHIAQSIENGVKQTLSLAANEPNVYICALGTLSTLACIKKCLDNR